MKKLTTFLAALLFFGIFNLYAPPAEPGGGGPVGDDPPVGAPIDGGAVVLLIAGAAYGVKKLRKSKIKHE